MALSKSALKAKFVTGAIPTQTDFANLIDGMLSMPLRGGSGDNTISFGDGDNTDRIIVNSLRYVTDNNVSYFLIGAWNQKLSNNVIVAILRFETDVTLLNVSVSYHVLSSSDVHYIADNIGYINEADEIDLIKYLQRSKFPFYNIQNRTNNNPNPRIINSIDQPDGNPVPLNFKTYTVYPVLQNGEWYVAYAFAMDVDLGVFIYRSRGKSQTKWTAIDSVVANDLENTNKFSKKLLY